MSPVSSHRQLVTGKPYDYLYAMEIREATEGDIPSIVDLLKLSLGESFMPKSEAFWRWKHIHNPFGPSPVLLAMEGEKLIGVRAFMRWEWRQGETIYKAVRAVDTATHPDYQGKGIFKKLTLQLVDHCEREGIHFIFNTPNKVSMPGYLKMGWQTNGKMPIRIRPLLNWSSSSYPHKKFEAQSFLDGINETVVQEKLVANRSALFMKWRYEDNPNLEYFQLVEKKNRVVYRLKTGRLGIEFRVVEVLDNHENRKTLNQQIVQVARAAGARFISLPSFMPMPGSIVLPYGPTVTIRLLTINNSLTFDFWQPTLGDMEVF